MCKKLIALLTALALALGCASALGENIKHERVYVVADAEGNVLSLTDSIRLENADGSKELTDRTRLTGIVNMGGDEPFALDGETLTWQAGGNDIIYQGTSDRAPAILPVVTLTLDGEPVTAEQLKTRTGEAELTVSYRVSGTLPALALSVMPLPAEGIGGLKTANCAVLTEMGQRFLIGWALPGLSEGWGLPVSFTASFHAENADLGWMMTLVTSDPLDIACTSLAGMIPFGLSPRLVVEDVKTALAAIRDGADVPALHGVMQLAGLKINELNGGLAQLDDGASQLSDGTSQLKAGVGKLKSGTMLLLVSSSAMNEGLKNLQKNSEALNTGASALADAVLNAASAQLKALGLDAPALTLENYAETLDALLGRLPDGEGEARAALDALRAQLDQASAFVAGLQSYTGGVDRMAASAEQLKSGMMQVDDGVKQLQDGAKQLADGASTLQKDGTGKLRDTLLDAEKSIANTLLPFLENQAGQALDLYETILGQTGASGYDLRPDGMTTVTVYLVRTDLY